MSLPNKIARLDAFAAGVLIGLSLIAPTFAATLDMPALPSRDWLLMALLVVLAVALAMRLMRGRSTPETGPAPTDEDLRWWKNP